MIEINQIKSYKTPEGVANFEFMNENFLKLHPGAPIHYFLECRDTEFHTHPGNFLTHIIHGGYREEVLIRDESGVWHTEVYERHPGTSHHMPLHTPHKLIGLLNGPCITRCEFGPSVQKSGFLKFDEAGQLIHRFWDSQEWHPYNSLSA